MNRGSVFHWCIINTLALVRVFSHVIEVKSGNLYFGTVDYFSVRVMANMLPVPPVVESIVRQAKEGTKDRIALGASHLGFIQASLYFDASLNPKSNKSHPCTLEAQPLERKLISSLGTLQSPSPVSACKTDQGAAVLYPGGALLYAFIELGDSFETSILKTFQPFNSLQEQTTLAIGEPLQLASLKLRSGNFIVIVSDTGIYSVDFAPKDFKFRVLLQNHNLIGVRKVETNNGYIFVSSDSGIHVFDATDGLQALLCSHFKPTDLPQASDRNILDFEVQKANVMTLVLSSETPRNYTTYQSLFGSHRLGLQQQEYMNSPDCLDLLLVLTPSGVYFFHLTDFFSSRPPKYGPVLSKFHITLAGLKSVIRNFDCLYLLAAGQNQQGEWMSTIYEYFILDYSYLNWEYEGSPPFELNRVWKSSYLFDRLELDDDFVYGVMGDVVIGYQRGIGAEVVDEIITQSFRFADASLDKLLTYRLPKDSVSLTLSKRRFVLYSLVGREPVISCKTKLDFAGPIHYQLNITTINCNEKIQSRRVWARDYSKKICRYLGNLTYELTSLSRWERLTRRLTDPRTTSYVIAGYLMGSLLLVLSVLVWLMYRRAKRTLQKSSETNRSPLQLTEPQPLLNSNLPTQL